MSIETQDTQVSYVGDGTSGPWNIDFPITEPRDVSAIMTDEHGVDRDLAYATDYTVVKSASSIGGTATVLVPVGSKILFYLNVPITQKRNFKNAGKTDVEEIEAGMDRLTLICQQLLSDIARSVKIDRTDTLTPDELLKQIEQSAAEVAGNTTKVEQAMSNLFAEKIDSFTTTPGTLEYKLNVKVVPASENMMLFLGSVAQEPGVSFTIVDGQTVRFSADPGAQKVWGYTSLSQSNPDIKALVEYYIQQAASLPAPDIANAGKGIVVSNDGTVYQIGGTAAGKNTGKAPGEIPTNADLPAQFAIAPQFIVKAPTGELPPNWSAGECDPPAQVLIADKIIPHVDYWGTCGVASADSEYSATFPAWKAFNGTNSGSTDGWASPVSTPYGELSYENHTPRTADSYSISSYDGASRNNDPKDFELYLDGDLVDTQTGISWTQAEKKTFTFTDRSWKKATLKVIDTTDSASNVYVGLLELGYTDVPSGSVGVPAGVRVAPVWDGRVELSDETAALQTLDLTTAADGLHHIYADIDSAGVWTAVGSTMISPEVGTANVGGDRVPAFDEVYMISNFGTVSASSETEERHAYKAWNKLHTATDAWVTLGGVTGWNRLVLDSPLRLHGVGIRSQNFSDQGFAPKDWTIVTGADVLPDTTIDTIIGETSWAQDEFRFFPLASSTVFKSFEMNITANNGQTATAVGEIVLFVSDDFLNTAEWKHYDKDGNQLRRVYLGWVRKFGGEIVEVQSYALGDSVTMPVNTGSNIVVNTSYTMGTPFIYGGTPFAEIEIYHESKWGSPGWIYVSSAGASQGTAVHPLASELLVRTASNALSNGYALANSAFSTQLSNNGRSRVKCKRGY